MAVKYHINPKTGRPNQCTATVKGCQFAKDGQVPEHYDTKEEARVAYEKQNEEQMFKKMRKDDETQQTDKLVEEEYGQLTDEHKKQYDQLHKKFEKDDLLTKDNAHEATMNELVRTRMTQQQLKAVDKMELGEQKKVYDAIRNGAAVNKTVNEAKEHTRKLNMDSPKVGLKPKTKKVEEDLNVKPNVDLDDFDSDVEPDDKELSSAAEKYALAASNTDRVKATAAELKSFKKSVNEEKINGETLQKALRNSVTNEGDMEEIPYTDYDTYDSPYTDYTEPTFVPNGDVTVNKKALVEQYYKAVKRDDASPSDATNTKKLIAKALDKHDMFSDYNYHGVVVTNDYGEPEVKGYEVLTGNDEFQDEIRDILNR